MSRTIGELSLDIAQQGLRHLQAALPWGAHDYTEVFQSRTEVHRDANHAALHVMKAAGKLATVIEEFDHTEPFAMTTDPERSHDPHALRIQASNALADLVICAVRIASRWPGGAIDLGQAIADRLAEKFLVKR